VDRRRDEAAAQAFSTVDITSELLPALGALAPRQRAVLVLRYFEDLTETQVADLLGCSVGTVKSTAARALERLRQHMGTDVSTPPDRTIHLITGTKGT
jgi:RNA polymerase sigma factor (sigma-70 family)